METQQGQTITPQPESGQNQPQPTVTVSIEHPASQPSEQPQPAAPTSSPSVAPAAQPAADTAMPATGAPASSQDGGWQYRQESTADRPGRAAPNPLSWSAAEFIEHPKGIGWYGLLGLAGVGLAVLDVLVIKDMVSTIVILIATAMFGVYAAHKPRTREYHLSPQGLQIGEKLHSFQAFKNFSVVDEGASVSVVFMPLKRFAPPLTIYVSSELEEQVLGYLSLFLPFEQHSGDAIDKFVRRIGF